MYSVPAVSPDGKSIAYSASLFRISSPAEPGNYMWLGSGIWKVDVKSGQAGIIYANPDPASAIGKVVWTSDGKKIVFYRYRDANGGEGGLNSLDIASGEVKTLVPVTNEHYTNIHPISMPHNEISFFSTDAQGEAGKRYILNVDTGKIRPQQVKISNKTLWHFTSIY